jgi:hypothetical protein
MDDHPAGGAKMLYIRMPHRQGYGAIYDGEVAGMRSHKQNPEQLARKHGSLAQTKISVTQSACRTRCQGLLYFD